MNRVDAGLYCTIGALSRLLRLNGVGLKTEAAGVPEGARSGLDALQKAWSMRGRSAALADRPGITGR
jgi:hypothetical protein